MIVFKFLFIYGFLVVILKADYYEDSRVSLTTKLGMEYIILVCKVKSTNSENFSTYLKCPFGVNNICYNKCNPACSTKGCLPMISDCTITQINNQNFEIQWKIKLRKVNKTGNWQCTHANQISNSISVEKQTYNIQTTVKSQILTTSTISSKPNTNYIVTIPEVIKTRPPDSKEIFTDSSNEFWIFITNPNVVLILVCVFTVSLLFNIIFLIRCALLRSLIDQYIQSNKITDSCLYRCFCIRINDGLPQTNMKIIQQSNPANNFTAYHREDVYDDMSASSQAERHLISNYSQYELEQESLLARKFWNADGSQTMIGRQSQYYPGQPMGNYVIVSGPVCSNRSHASYIPVTNQSVLNHSQRTCITDEMERSSSHDSHKNEPTVIYSQPIKNRPKSLGQYSDSDTMKLTETCPPAPPIRTCTETLCYRTSTPCMDNIQPSLTMKNVDLIEHCSHSNVSNGQHENLS